MRDTTFVADDRWDGLVLKAHGNLYVTDWGEPVDYGPDFFPDVPEIEVYQVLPEGGLLKVGVLGELGIFDARFRKVPNGSGLIEVVTVASWADIEILPEYAL